MIDRDDYKRLADELDDWHDCADGDVSAGNGHFRVVCENDSEQQRLNLRATLREAAEVLRSASVKVGEVVAWQFRCANDTWIPCERPSPNELRDEPEKFRRLYTTPPTASVGAMREALVHTLASLAAAISLLERTPKAKKAAPSDKMFDQMIVDYKNALEAGRKATLAAAGHKLRAVVSVQVETPDAAAIRAAAFEEAAGILLSVVDPDDESDLGERAAEAFNNLDKKSMSERLFAWNTVLAAALRNAGEKR